MGGSGFEPSLKTCSSCFDEYWFKLIGFLTRHIVVRIKSEHKEEDSGAYAWSREAQAE